MIPLNDLFETHLTVADLKRAMDFYGQRLGLELATVSWERRVAFYWIGGRGNAMLGLWESGTGPQKMSLHLAFRAALADVLDAPARLRAAGIAFLPRPRWWTEWAPSKAHRGAANPGRSRLSGG